MFKLLPNRTQKSVNAYVQTVTNWHILEKPNAIDMGKFEGNMYNVRKLNVNGSLRLM